MSKIIGKWRNTWKCALCGEEHEGWGSNPAPLLDYNSALVCPECNQIVVAFHIQYPPFFILFILKCYLHLLNLVKRNHLAKFLTLSNYIPIFISRSKSHIQKVRVLHFYTEYNIRRT